MTAFLRSSRLALLVACAAALASLGSLCVPDECDDGDTQCTEVNARRVCRRPGAEVATVWKTEPCLPGAFCAIGASGRALCERQPLTPCTDPNAMSCANEVLTTCEPLPDGGLVLADLPCNQGYSCMLALDGGFRCNR